jgi:hypothetical protein
MNFPKIIPNTFTTEQTDTGVYRSELKGTVQVEFEGIAHTVPATRVIGVEIFYAEGFKAKGMNKKDYRLSVSYRPGDDSHDCRVGGGIVKISSIFKA